MRAVTLAVFVSALVACGRPPETPTTGVDIVPASLGTTYRWSFDPAPHFAPSPPSPIQVTADRTRFLAVLGKWGVERDDSAPSAPFVMKQARADGHPSRILVEQLGFKGVAIRTKCRLGTADSHVSPSCGVIFAARAEDDYLVVRIEGEATKSDGSERALRLVRVIGALEDELAMTRVDATGWTEVAVSARGREAIISVNGAAVLTHPIPEVGLGRVGLFARGDASFDDLSALALDRADL